MSEYRTELKFLCSENTLHSIESRISLLCFKDSHADENGRYRIRSVYFDSPGMECYIACKSGVDNRKKYRIRIYNESPDRINLECKTGFHGKKKKESALLTPTQLEEILLGKVVSPEKQSGVLWDFRNRQVMGYQPRLIVGYLRTAYVHPAGNVRITFDREIMAMPVETLWEKYNAGVPVLPFGKAILEVKYDDVLPGAIRKLIKESNLRTTSFSKYAICHDALFGDLKYSI